VIPVVIGLFGLMIGSFLNVVIHRVPLRRSIVWPSSRCPHCEARIKTLNNVPVLSYLLLRGGCRECGARISPRYSLVEALTGVLFALAAYEFGLSLALVWALVLISALVVLAGIDLEHRLLPNVVMGPASLVGFVLCVAGDPGRWWVYLISAFGVAAGLFALALAYPGGMGMGDEDRGHARGFSGTVRGAHGLSRGVLGGSRWWSSDG
jgi:leader peptidase (prepilin peptidase) / N-methyltransferase